MFEVPLLIIKGAVCTCAIIIVAVIALEVYQRLTAIDWEKIEPEIKIVK